MAVTALEASVNTDELRIILLGKTGSGKSATGNTILGRFVFEEDTSPKSVTTECQRETAVINGRHIYVVDTPGYFDTNCTNDKIKDEIKNCISLAEPGPNVFLLVIAGGRYTEEEKNTVEMIQKMFGEESLKYTIVLFTRGDVLRKTLKEYLMDADQGIKDLLSLCGDRCHLFNNKDRCNKDQVNKLLDEIHKMLKANEGGYYTAEMFQEAEKALKQAEQREQSEINQETNKTQPKSQEETKTMDRSKEFYLLSFMCFIFLYMLWNGIGISVDIVICIAFLLLF